jgi:DNA-binding transcriptional MocR family regulator
MLKGNLLQPRSHIGSIRRSKQFGNVIARLTPGSRLHQTISIFASWSSTAAPAIPPIISIAKKKMGGQSSISALVGVGKKKGEEPTKTSKRKAINLLRGWPATSLLPAAALHTASQTALSDQSIWAAGLEYGPDPGYQPLREELAGWLGRFYGDVAPTSRVEGEEERDHERKEKVRVGLKAQADRITITGGASQSVACLLQSFTDPALTLAVWMVAPCYFLACPIMADAGFAGRLRAAPEDDEGIDLTVLEREIRALEEERKKNGGDDCPKKYKDASPYRKIYRHVIYCVPSFSNPSGRTMTLSRRRGLVDLARKYDALVICDDVYDMLQWRVLECPPPHTPSSFSFSTATTTPSQQNINLDKAILPRLADLDIAKGRSAHDPPGKHFGHAVSNGSFSKLVAPGVRTGWTYSTADLALGNSQTGSTRSGGAASQLAATIVCQLMKKKKKSTSPSSSSTFPPTTSDEKGNGDDETARKGEQREWETCELDTHIRQALRPAYARRHGLLVRTIQAVLGPLGVRVHEGSDGVYGGYFVWMTLPTTRTTSTSTIATAWPAAKAIADRCRADEDLMIGNGELFMVHGDEGAVRFDNAIRLCFAWEDEEDLVDGVERLGRVIQKMLDEGPGGWEPKDKEMDNTGDVK